MLEFMQLRVAVCGTTRDYASIVSLCFSAAILMVTVLILSATKGNQFINTDLGVAIYVANSVTATLVIIVIQEPQQSNLAYETQV